jgi:hypothetical protein
MGEEKGDPHGIGANRRENSTCDRKTSGKPIAADQPEYGAGSLDQWVEYVGMGPESN